MATPKPLSSVSRAVTIVEYLASQPWSGVALGRLAADLKINKATAYTTLATLREHRWVEQDETNGFYRLGPGLRVLSSYETSVDRHVAALHPHLVAIGKRFNELVHLGMLAGTSIVYLDKVEPDRAIRVVSEIGKEAPAVRTALGRALLATRADRESRIEEFFADPGLEGLSRVQIEELRSHVAENLARLTEDGWTEEIEENEPGIACVAVPLLSDRGTALALSITAPAERMTGGRRAELGAGIREEIASLPEDLGLALPPLAR